MSLRPSRSAAGQRVVVNGVAGTAAAISAHRGGGETAPPGTYEAYRSSLATGAEYVEFDVRRTADGQFVSCHGSRTPRGRRVAAVSYRELCAHAGFQVPLVTGIMQLLAGQATAHFDLKETADAAEIIEQAVSMLGPGGLVVTTRAAPVAAAIKRDFPGVRVALTVGGDLAERARYLRERTRTPALTRLDWVTGCHADWAAVHHRTARGDVLAGCRRLGIRTMVWTANSDRALARWLAHPGVDVVVTDRPVRAAELRRGLLAVSTTTPG